MKLQKWLKTNEIKVIDFAQVYWVDQTGCYKYIEGSTFPRRNVLSKILKVTNGDVTPIDFMRVDVDHEQDVRSTTELRP
jgi:predicted transcriptional regulator